MDQSSLQNKNFFFQNRILLSGVQFFLDFAIGISEKQWSKLISAVVLMAAYIFLLTNTNGKQ